jgi:hypothetical protein
VAGRLTVWLAGWLVCWLAGCMPGVRLNPPPGVRGKLEILYSFLRKSTFSGARLGGV